MKRCYNYEEAIAYFGVKRKFFDNNIRDRVTWERAGTCMVAERVDLDRAWDEYLAERRDQPEKGSQQCPENRPAYIKPKPEPGRSTKFTAVTDFATARQRITALRKRGSSTPSQS